MAKEVEAMTAEQKKIIKEAVASKKIDAIPREEYAKLTKASAQKLIDTKINPKPAKQAPEAKGGTDEKATRHQLNAIAEAVENGEMEKLPADEWKSLTKADATKIISDLWAKRPPEPATDSQKERITELVKAGHLSPMGREKFHELDKIHASKLISIGKHNQEQGKTVEGYDPNYKPLRGDDPASKEQKERIKELVHGGYLNGVPGHKWDKMTVQKASQLIFVGNNRETAGEKAPVRAPDKSLAEADIPY